MKTSRFRRSLHGGFFAIVALGLLIGGALSAATYTWDPAGDQSNSGGAGTWNTSSLFWNDNDLAPNIAWPNGDNLAVFAGAGGTVTLGNAITVGDLNFNVTGYTIAGAGANTLTFTGTPVINLASGVAATIAAPIAGPAVGLSIVGAGSGSSLSLGPVGGQPTTLTGGITINNTTLIANVSQTSNRLGANAINLQAGSTLQINPTATMLAGLSGRMFTSSGLTGGDTSTFDFTKVAAGLRTDPNLNYTDLKTQPAIPIAPQDSVAIQWMGQIKITTGGTYKFGTASDDGSRLWIDGVLVVNNDGGKGRLDSFNPNVVLTPGLHDIRVDYMNGSGGAGEILSYSGPDQAGYAAVPASVLFQAETNTLAANGISTAIQLGNNLNVTGNSTVNLNGADFTQVQFGTLSVGTGNTLNITGLAGKTMRVGATTLGGAAGTVTLNTADSNLAIDGVVAEGAAGMTIVKTGIGRLIFSQTDVANTLSATSTFDVQNGTLELVGRKPSIGTPFNPIGSAKIKLNGGNVTLSSNIVSASSNLVFNNAIDIAASGTIQNINNAAQATELSGAITFTNNNSTLTLDSISGGQPSPDRAAFLTLSGTVTTGVTTGSVIAFKSTQLGSYAASRPGSFNLSGDFSNYLGDFRFTGTKEAVVFGNITNNLNLQKGRNYTVTVDAGSSGVISAALGEAVTGAGTVGLIKDGDGILTLSNTGSSYTGVTRINDGTLRVTNMNNANFPSSIGVGFPGGAAQLVLDGGATGGATLSYVGNPSVDPNQFASSRRSFTLGTGATAGTISADGLGVGAEFKFGVWQATATGQQVAFLGAGTRTLTLGGVNTGNNVFGAILADQDVTTGKTSLSKTGTGRWIIVEAFNTYSGGTTVNAGTLSAAVNGAFGTGNVTVNTGATLELRGVDYLSTAPTLILQNGSTATAVVNTGAIGGTPAAVDSSWAGGLTVNGTSANIRVDTGVNLTFSGTVDGTGGIVQLGSGSVTFSGGASGTRNTSATASYTTQSGTLTLDYSSNNNSKLSNSALLILGGSRLGGTVNLVGGTHVEVVSGVTLNAGDNIINGTPGNSILRMNGITRNTGATIRFSASNIASTDKANDDTGILGAWATVGLDDWAANSGVADGGAPVEGSGNGLIAAYSGYTLTSVQPNWGSTFNMSVDGDNTPAAGAQANTLRFFTPAGDLEQTVTLAGGVNKILAGGILVASNMGTTAAVINGPGTLAGQPIGPLADLLIIQNNTLAPFEISANIVNNAPLNGVDKSGPGNLILSGNNTYNGITTLNNGVTTVHKMADGGAASGIGASTATADRLVFNGGTLQVNAVGGIMSSNRGFTSNETAVWDVGNENTTLSLSGQYATPAAAGNYEVTKIGSGVMELVRTTAALSGGYGLTKWDVSDGTVRLIAGVDNEYARSDAALTMSGGTLEFVGTGAPASTRNQVMSGAFTVGEGASVIRVKSSSGVTSILTLQNTTSPSFITNQKGGTLLISEDNSSGGSSIVRIAGEVGVDVLQVLPRVVYQTSIDSTHPGVNYFAVIDSTAYDVGASDNISIGGIPSHDFISDVSAWTALQNVTDGISSGDAYFGTISADASVNTIRFYNNSGTASVVTIDPGITLALESGAILQTTHSGTTGKSIVGGNLTSNLYNYDADSVPTSADLIVHNWNPLRSLLISSDIIDNVDNFVPLNFIQSGNGTTVLSGTNTYTGTTYVQDGVLRLDSANAVSGGIGTAGGLSHLRLDGGVVGLNSGDFTRGLGAAADQVDWTSSGGFAAYTADRTVNLGGAGAAVEWGAGSFVPDNDTFILGAYDADKTVNFTNGINLGRKDRMIRTVDGSALVDGRLNGVISGATGALVKSGQGGLELAAANTYAAGTTLAQGLLIASNNASLGTGTVNMGSTADSRAVDAIELRFTGTTLANAITVGNASLGNTESISTIRTTNVAAAVTGAVNLQKQVFLAPESGKVASYASLTGTKGFRLIDGGTLSLANANTYGTATGGPGAAVDGGTIIRNGTILVGNSTSLGASAVTVELGDATYAQASVNYATNGRSVLGVENNNPSNTDGVEALGGVFVADGNGTRDGLGVAIGGGTGAFLNIDTTINGHSFTAGERLLVKDETEHPERNGLYEVLTTAAPDESGNATTSMNLVRVADFDEASEMRYGSQVTVLSGSNAGTYFMASPDVVTVSGTNDPSQWVLDAANPNVSLYATAATTVANAIDVNANGSGTTAIGTNSDVAGVSFTGNVTLQNVRGSSVGESKTLTLESASSTGSGVTFSGIISEADGAGGTPDVLSVAKTGAGVTSLTGLNTYHGTTTISAGNLQVGNGNVGQSGTGATSLNGATAILSGTGTVQGAATLLQGVLRPGDAGGSLEGTLNFSNGVTFNQAAPATAAEFTMQGTDALDETGDRISITGALTLDSDSNFIVTNGASWTPTLGQSWTLMSWTGLLTLNGWSTGTNLRTGAGDTGTNLDLVDISSSGFVWDITSLINGSTGGSLVVSIVPEPSRMLLLCFGLTAMICRRRRKHAPVIH